MTQKDSEGRTVFIMSPFNSACLDYGVPEKIRGVWFDEPEGGPFVEGEQIVPRKRPRFRAYLSLADREALDVDVPHSCNPVFYLEFIGRRAVREYGREGVRNLGSAMEDDEIEVIRGDQVLRSKFLGFVKMDFKAGKQIVRC
jgi:hypothetical protein